MVIIIVDIYTTFLVWILFVSDRIHIPWHVEWSPFIECWVKSRRAVLRKATNPKVYEKVFFSNLHNIRRLDIFMNNSKGMHR